MRVLTVLTGALLAVILLPLDPASAMTAGAALSSTDRVLCDMATSQAERETGVPDQLLTAISRVETGQRDPETGRTRAWPWTIDVEGQGHLYPTKQDAIDAVRSYQAAGARSIDVGCMQVNLLQHPDAFGSLSDAFDPATNALWAARFLSGLFRQTGSWPHAAAAYHSQTPDIGADYQEQVLRMWAEGDGSPDDPRSRTAGDPGGRRGGGNREVASGGAAGAGSIGGFSPFGADRSPVIAARYNSGGPAAASTGRSLTMYRAMPIAMSGRPLFPSRF